MRRNVLPGGKMPIRVGDAGVAELGSKSNERVDAPTGRRDGRRSPPRPPLSADRFRSASSRTPRSSPWVNSMPTPSPRCRSDAPSRVSPIARRARSVSGRDVGRGELHEIAVRERPAAPAEAVELARSLDTERSQLVVVRGCADETPSRARGERTGSVRDRRPGDHVDAGRPRPSPAVSTSSIRGRAPGHCAAHAAGPRSSITHHRAGAVGAASLVRRFSSASISSRAPATSSARSGTTIADGTVDAGDRLPERRETIRRRRAERRDPRSDRRARAARW